MLCLSANLCPFHKYQVYTLCGLFSVNFVYENEPSRNREFSWITFFFFFYYDMNLIVIVSFIQIHNYYLIISWLISLSQFYFPRQNAITELDLDDISFSYLSKLGLLEACCTIERLVLAFSLPVHERIVKESCESFSNLSELRIESKFKNSQPAMRSSITFCDAVSSSASLRHLSIVRVRVGNMMAKKILNNFRNRRSPLQSIM